jgi:hypothetical protein
MKKVKPIRKFWLGLPLILIPIGLRTQQLLVDASRGVGGGFVEVPRASSHKIIHRLKDIGRSTKSPVIVSDCTSPSLLKFESSYLKSRQFLFPVKDFFPYSKTEAWARRQFDLKSGGLKPQLNHFEEDPRVSEALTSGADVTLLECTGNQTVLNRIASPEFSREDVSPVTWKNTGNHLMFIHSELGNSAMTGNRLKTSFFPPIIENLTHTTVAPVGRYLLFRIINPTQEFRLVLNLSALDHRLPPASVVGETRVPINFVGFGSGRVVSGPIKPQVIEGVPYICIDMGMDGLPIPEKRTGLMKLWRTDLPLDFKLLVGMARDISIISNEEYEKFKAPRGIRTIPDDLLNPEFEYSGIYDDGWLSANSYFILAGNTEAEPLVVRGVLPLIDDPSFTTNVTALVDGQEVGRRTISVGEFEYRFPVPTRPGRRRVELRFDRTLTLLNNDTRRPAVLLRCLGFGNSSCASVGESDVVDESRGIWRGDNWYPLEKHNGQSFRWVKNDAEILIAPDVQGEQVAIDLEPGPGLDGHGLKLQALDSDGQLLAEQDIAHRQSMQFKIPAHATDSKAFYTVHLHSVNAGRSVGKDARTLNFRVFRTALQSSAALQKPAPVKPAGPDVVSSEDIVQLGANWNPPEAFGGELFRWVDNDAIISIADANAAAKGISIEVEPGPGVRKKPALLRVLDSTGHQVQTAEITGRQTVIIYPPTGTSKKSEYRLHLEGGGQQIPSDPRVLNFRVFRVYSAQHAAVGNPDITEGAGLKLGAGWYPFEKFTDGTFRWVNNDAQFSVDPGHRQIGAEVQPGPGFSSGKILLKLFDSAGKQVQATEVKGRQTIKLLLPNSNGKQAAYILHVDGGGKKIPSDPRILNFRVFRLKALD